MECGLLYGLCYCSGVTGPLWATNAFYFPGVPLALCFGTLLAILMSTVPTARVVQVLNEALFG
jgi:hypothetical protein